MAEKIVKFKESWINNNDIGEIDDNFEEIINFYLWENPCNNVSSRGITMKEHGWKDNVWKNRDLRTFFLNVANLKSDLNFKKVKNLSDISSAVNKIGLGKHFIKI